MTCAMEKKPVSNKLWRRLQVAVVLAAIEVANDGATRAADDTKRITSTFNQQWLDAVISIELSEAGKDPEPVGTGFLVLTARKHVLIVTANHVIADFLSGGSHRLGYRLNIKGSGSVVVWEDDLQKQGLGKWYTSPTTDIACRFVAWPNAASVVGISTEQFLPTDALMAGAPLLVLGFPLGLRSIEHAQAIARHGIVARADSEGIVADAFVFPGNSGGPVVYSPPIKVGGVFTSSLVNEEKLVGIVLSFIPYREPAISPLTKRVRVVFEENSGLANLATTNQLSKLLESDDVTKQDGALP